MEIIQGGLLFNTLSPFYILFLWHWKGIYDRRILQEWIFSVSIIGWSSRSRVIWIRVIFCWSFNWRKTFFLFFQVISLEFSIRSQFRGQRLNYRTKLKRWLRRWHSRYNCTLAEEVRQDLASGPFSWISTRETLLNIHIAFGLPSKLIMFDKLKIPLLRFYQTGLVGVR